MRALLAFVAGANAAWVAENIAHGRTSTLTALNLIVAVAALLTLAADPEGLR